MKVPLKAVTFEPMKVGWIKYRFVLFSIMLFLLITTSCEKKTTNCYCEIETNGVKSNNTMVSEDGNCSQFNDVDTTMGIITTVNCTVE
ncbi:MAG: hypothetical protein IPL12_18040 [Bacteroidetes bacterium]|nr:hypothetical protein [Bacteroidota bacterium]